MKARIAAMAAACAIAAFVFLGISSKSQAASTDLAVGFAEAAGNVGAWTVPAPYVLATNWDGTTGTRPVAITSASVAAPGTITGPVVTNAAAQTGTGGSLLLLGGSNPRVRGVTAANYAHGVTGGSAVTIANPTGLAAGDLAAVYIDTANTITPPAGWTQQRHDGEGTLWTKAIPTLPANLGSWSTTGSTGWTYTAIAFTDASCTPIIDGVGGAGAQSSSSVNTGTAVAGGATCAGPTSTPTPAPTATNTPIPPTATPTNTPAAATATPTNTPVPPTNTPVPPTPTPGGSWVTTPGGSNNLVPFGEDRCHDATKLSVDVKADFGATGNGTTDDHTAFVNAIATGKVVHIPAGTYRLSQVELPAESTVVLCGAGQGTTTLIQATSPTTTEAMFHQTDFSTRGHVAYLEIQNLTLDGNKANVERRPSGSSLTNYGMVDVMVRKGLVANNELRNAYHALRIEDVGDQATTPGEMVIRDNWFHDQALEAGFTGGTTHNIHLSKFYASNSVIWVARNNIEACGSGSGESCTAPSTTAGQSSGGLLFIPNTGGPDGLPEQTLRIYDNDFRNTGMNMVGTDEPEGSIYIYQQADNSQILHNRVINAVYEGIVVFSSNNVEIGWNYLEGNILPVPTSAGYSHMEYYAIIADSRQTNFPTYVNSSGWRIHDNTVANSTWYKIGVCACFNVDASGNGTGSDIVLSDNGARNNINNYVSSTTHMTPESQEGATGVTIWGEDSTRN